MFGALVSLLLSLLLGTVLDAATSDEGTGDDDGQAQDDPVQMNTDLIDGPAPGPDPEPDEEAEVFDPIEDMLVIEFDAALTPDPEITLEETEEGTEVLLQGAVIASLHGVDGLTEDDVLLRPISS